MQLYADITRRPLSVIGSAQGPALGSAIHAAVAAGAYPDVPAAARAMGKFERAAYVPDPSAPRRTTLLYAEYLRLHDYFGRGGERGTAPVARARSDDHRGEMASDSMTADLGTPLRREVCALHAAAPRQRPCRLDRRQRLRPGAGRRPVGDQTERRGLRRPDPRVDGASATWTATSSRATTSPPATPARTPTSTGTAPTSAASCTPTRPTRPRGPRAARRSRACSPRWPTSSAARSRSARSR